MVLGDLAVPFGVVLREGVRLEEQRGCDGDKKVVGKGEAGALCLVLAVPEAVEVLWNSEVLFPQLSE